MRKERLPPLSRRERLINGLINTAVVLVVSPVILILLSAAILYVSFIFWDENAYHPGRDTTAYWAEGQIEILRGHDLETGEKEYLLRIGDQYVENGTVTAYKRSGNPVQVLAENRLYLIDEATLSYTVNTLTDAETAAIHPDFRQLFP